MRLPGMQNNIQRRVRQQLAIQGINLTDNYQDGQLESNKNITSDRYPLFATADKLKLVNTGVPDGFNAISIFAWEKLFVVSDEPSEKGGYKCYYGGVYCGDAKNKTIPKQYAVVNSKLVMFPDKVYFNLYDKTMTSHPLGTANLIHTISSGTVEMRQKVQVSE